MDGDSNGQTRDLPVFDQALGNFLANNDVGIVSVSLTAIINIIKNILLVRLTLVVSLSVDLMISLSSVAYSSSASALYLLSASN